MQLSRRELLSAAALPWAPSRPKIAAIITEYRKHSHGQHIVDRFLEGYGWDGEHHHPNMDLVSLYVDQRPNGDLTPDRAARFPGMKVYPTIAEALTAGTSKLAVDGVKVFEVSNRVVPVFNDKHLSWNWDWAKEMYDTSRRMKFPLMAGSSLPVTWRTPSLEFPTGARVEEAMCVCYGGVDSYDFHGLETIQGMVERRKGGESGVEWVQAYRGAEFWAAYKEKVWPTELVEAALCRSHTLVPAREGFNDIFPTVDDMKRLVKDPVAYRYKHSDGLMSTMILMSGLIRDFNFSARLTGQKDLFSTQMYLPMPDGRTTLANFFSPLVYNSELMYLTGKETYPLERTLLTTGLTAAGVESLHIGQKRFATPHLNIHYQATKESTFWRS